MNQSEKCTTERCLCDNIAHATAYDLWNGVKDGVVCTVSIIPSLVLLNSQTIIL